MSLVDPAQQTKRKRTFLCPKSAMVPVGRGKGEKVGKAEGSVHKCFTDCRPMARRGWGKRTTALLVSNVTVSFVPFA
jgi:hypothetical protein